MNSPDLMSRTDSLKCELAGESLLQWGSVRIQVNGWSMLPTIWPGDTLAINATGQEEIAPGDIALFKRSGRMFVHRVLGMHGRQIVTRGDAMAHADSPVANRDLLGKVQFIVRNGKRIDPARNLNFVARVVAGFVRRSEVAARIVIKMRGVFQSLQASAQQS